MRKHIRTMLRYLAEREKTKPSFRVNRLFNQIQIKRHGRDYRTKHQATGTHKKKLWKSRINQYT